jgi:hypothetical protein
MLRIIVAVLCLQLAGCITITKGEQFNTDVATVNFKDSKIVGLSYVQVYETNLNNSEEKEKFGLSLDQGEDSINIFPKNITQLQSDIQVSMTQTTPTGITLPNFADIQKGYSVDVFFTEGKRFISLKTGTAYMVFDENNINKLLVIINKVAAKNESLNNTASAL